MVENLTYQSLPGASAPVLAFGIQLDPGDLTRLDNGPINNRFVGGHLRGGNGAVSVQAGFGNVFSGIETKDVGAPGGGAIDYDFGPLSASCDAATYPGGCASNNTVLGGFADLGSVGSQIRYYARFEQGARDNALYAGYVRRIHVLEHDKEQEATGDSGNRVMIGAAGVHSVLSPGATSTPFFKLTTADPFASVSSSTTVRAAVPSSAPNEPVVVVPNQSGPLVVGP